MHYIILPLGGMKEKIETPLVNLSEFMRQFNITYTSYYNRRYHRVGHLYQGRYKSILIQKENYLTILSRYIHLNPVRVGKMQNISTSEKEKYLKQFKWSSLKGYLNEDNINSFVDYKTVLAEYGEIIKRDVRYIGKLYKVVLLKNWK